GTRGASAALWTRPKLGTRPIGGCAGGTRTAGRGAKETRRGLGASVAATESGARVGEGVQGREARRSRDGTHHPSKGTRDLAAGCSTPTLAHLRSLYDAKRTNGPSTRPGDAQGT